MRLKSATVFMVTRFVSHTHYSFDIVGATKHATCFLILITINLGNTAGNTYIFGGASAARCGFLHRLSYFEL